MTPRDRVNECSGENNNKNNAGGSFSTTETDSSNTSSSVAGEEEEEEEEKEDNVVIVGDRVHGNDNNNNNNSKDDKDDEHRTTATTTTRVLYTDDGAPYVLCDSKTPFVNPTTPSNMTPAAINQKLNLHLGQTFLIRKNSKVILWILRFLLYDIPPVQWLERVVHVMWSKCVPLRLKRGLVFAAWKVYFAVHRRVLGRTTGLHRTCSEEYHALTTVFWWSRFFPVPPFRMRFSLSQLPTCTPDTVQAARTEWITAKQQQEQQERQQVGGLSMTEVPDCQKDHCTVRGLYLHRNPNDSSGSGSDGESSDGRPNRGVLFWIYGGAFIAGDCIGNSSLADWVGRRCSMDVFIPQFRLGPEEANMDDVLWDVLLAYRWLVVNRRRRCCSSGDVIVVGISSGAAIAVRLMQYIAEYERKETLVPAYMDCLLQPVVVVDDADAVRMKQPTAALLFGPYVDYTQPADAGSSFVHYPVHDLVVTEAVQEYGLPYLDTFIPNNDREQYSPVRRSMEGLPPMCVIVSEHEAVYDMAVQLVNAARKQGVSCSIGVWKYMCHVWSFLWAFLPEGRLSMDYACDWIRKHQQTKKPKPNKTDRQKYIQE